MKKFDIIIIGGGTAGCACAYTSAKLGLKTLLIEKNIHLGGAITSGLVIPSMKSSDNQINTDFFNDLVIELQKLNGQITYLDGNKGWFNHELCKVALDRMMSKVGVNVLFNSEPIQVNTENKNVVSLIINSEMLSEPIGAKYFIDATGNSEIFSKLNCEFLENSPEEFQPASLRFIMSGINLEEFASWLSNYDNDREVTSVYNTDGQIHLSTAYTWDSNKNWALQPLFDDAVDKNILKDTDRSYFQVFTISDMNSSLAFNCPRMPLNTDILDKENTSKALIEAREAIIRIADFCKIYFPGFGNAYISNIADALGIRVSKRIKGKYIYKSEDLREGKKFANPVLIGNYPIDVHSNDKNKSVLEKVNQEYQLPVESLMSIDFDNLFAIGRNISADFYAQAALRIQPSCFSMGEGLAKFLAEK